MNNTTKNIFKLVLVRDDVDFVPLRVFVENVTFYNYTNTISLKITNTNRIYTNKDNIVLMQKDASDNIYYAVYYFKITDVLLLADEYTSKTYILKGVLDSNIEITM